MNQLPYRSAALDRLSSPERFDEILRISASKLWAALAGVFLITAAAALWSWFGSISTTADGSGVLVRAGGVLSVNTSATGQVTEFSVKPGDMIHANQVIARISNPMLDDRVRLAKVELAEAQQEAERTIKVKADTAQLQMAANDRERANLQREIAGLEERSKFAAELVSQKQQLFADRLIIKLEVAEAQQKAAEIQDEIARRRARIDQIEAERFVNAAASEDSRAATLEHVADLERRLTALRGELRQATTVISAAGGEVIEVKTYQGAIVSADAPMLTLQPKERLLEALAYVPSNQAKLVRVGMDAELSPSTVRKEEHGYLEATVLTVSDYPLTPTALMRRFENESLTSAITAQGPVTEVRLALRPSPASYTGYHWSSPHGPRVTLSSGTLCSVRIVIERQRPVSLLIPLLREGLLQ